MGFGSVKIKVEEVHFLEKSITEKKISKAFCSKLNEIWKEEFNKLGNLFELLYYNKDENIKVRYPKLKKEDKGEKEDGYEELKDKDEYKLKNRQNNLKKPWKEWT